MRTALAILAALALAATACGGGTPSGGSPDGTTAPTATAEPLTGTFALTAGQCDDGGVTSGSWFRMVQTGGTVEDGPYVDNGDSPCGDTTYTPLRPGTDAGLATGEFQPNPEPAFDEDGHAVADRIVRPQTFFGTDFSTATNPSDPQTGTQVDPPRIVHDGQGGLSGDLRAFAAAWNGQHFNQGAPKPGGATPGNTAPVTGTYDPATGRFTLQWASQIEGGPFDRFTGVWHLEGTFEPGG